MYIQNNQSNNNNNGATSKFQTNKPTRWNNFRNMSKKLIDKVKTNTKNENKNKTTQWNEIQKSTKPRAQSIRGIAYQQNYAKVLKLKSTKSPTRLHIPTNTPKNNKQFISNPTYKPSKRVSIT